MYPLQMRWLICTKMASCLRMIKTPAPSTVCADNNSVHVGEFPHNSQQPSHVADNGKTKLLAVNTEIRDLLRAKLRSEAEALDKAEEDADKKREWKLASAVVDRIVFIIFGIVSVGGTAVFITVFAFACHLSA